MTMRFASWLAATRPTARTCRRASDWTAVRATCSWLPTLQETDTGCYGDGRSIGLGVRVRCSAEWGDRGHGQQCDVRRSCSPVRRSCPREHAACVDGRLSPHGDGVGEGCWHHAANGERSLEPDDSNWPPERREAGAASLSSTGYGLDRV